MQAYKKGKEQQLTTLKQHTQVMQRIVGAVLEGKNSQAVQLWNQLGLKPELAEIKLDYKADAVIFRSRDGKAISLNVNDLLKELDELL